METLPQITLAIKLHLPHILLLVGAIAMLPFLLKIKKK